MFFFFSLEMYAKRICIKILIGGARWFSLFNTDLNLQVIHTERDTASLWSALSYNVHVRKCTTPTEDRELSPE